MRAVSRALGRMTAGAVFFRDPSLRVAIVVKATFSLVVKHDGAALELAPGQEPILRHDLVPRKARADVMLTGEAFSSTLVESIPIEVGLGTKLRKRSAVRTRGGTPALSAQIRSMGPILLGLESLAPKSDREAAFSAAWMEAGAEGRQVAPFDQQTDEPIGMETTLSLANLTLGGGDTTMAVPAMRPYAFLVEGRDTARAQRLAMRCDSVHIDASRGHVMLGFRGEADLERFSAPPEVVLGWISPGERMPNAADLEAALASWPELALERIAAPVQAESRTRSVDRPGATQAVSGRERAMTLPFSLRTTPAPVGPPRALAEDGDTTDDGTGTVAFEAQSPRNAARRTPPPVPPPLASDQPLVGDWRLGALVEARADRDVYSAVHGVLGVEGRLALLRAAGDRASTERFDAELELRMSVMEAAFVPILDRGVTREGKPFVVDALPRGVSVQSTLAKRRFDRLTALSIVADILGALGALHKAGLVHAALSPSGVFLEGTAVTLAPSSALRRVGDARPPSAESDPSLACPEVMLGSWAEVDGRSDVWSAAALFVLLVSGEPVHRGASKQRRVLAAMTQPAPPVATLTSDLNAPLARVLDQALDRFPRTRPSDAHDLLRRMCHASPDFVWTGSGLDAEQSTADDERPTNPPQSRDVFAETQTADTGPIESSLPFVAKPALPGSLGQLGQLVRAAPLPPAPAPPAEDDDEQDDLGSTVFGTASPAAAALPFGAAPAQPPLASDPAIVSPAPITPPRVVPSPVVPAVASLLATAPDVAPPAMMGLGRVGLGVGAPPLATPLVTPRVTADYVVHEVKRSEPEEPALVDPKTIAAVISAPIADRETTLDAHQLDPLGWALGLEKWAKTIDDEERSGKKDALRTLLSALHESALVKR